MLVFRCGLQPPRRLPACFRLECSRRGDPVPPRTGGAGRRPAPQGLARAPQTNAAAVLGAVALLTDELHAAVDEAAVSTAHLLPTVAGRTKGRSDRLGLQMNVLRLSHAVFWR
jgi:hypothetical protein